MFTVTGDTLSCAKPRFLNKTFQTSRNIDVYYDYLVIVAEAVIQKFIQCTCTEFRSMASYRVGMGLVMPLTQGCTYMVDRWRNTALDTRLCCPHLSARLQPCIVTDIACVHRWYTTGSHWSFPLAEVLNLRYVGTHGLGGGKTMCGQSIGALDNNDIGK